MSEYIDQPLFDMEEALTRPAWDKHVLSLSEDERQIIRWIMALHNDGQPFDLDPTYSYGRFWNGTPKPRYRFDLDPDPRAEGVAQADARALPIESGSIGSIMFDPPFVIGPSDKPGIMRDRFSCYKNVRELWKFYNDALVEFARVLRYNGLLAFKCQDVVSSGKQHLSHVEVVNMANQNGFYAKDLFILHRRAVAFSPNMASQQHARKTHSYFLVFRKVGTR